MGSGDASGVEVEEESGFSRERIKMAGCCGCRRGNARSEALKYIDGNLVIVSVKILAD